MLQKLFPRQDILCQRRVIFWSFLLFATLSLTFIMIAFYGENYKISFAPWHRSTGFLVSTSGCKIPDIDPLDASIKKFIHHQNPLVCDAKPSITYIDGSFLRINHTVLKEFYNDQLDYCEYQSIHRPNMSDKSYQYSKNTITIKSDTEMDEEFIRIACYGVHGGMLSTSFHAFILEKPIVEKQAQTKLMQDDGRSKEQFNLLIIGVDSVSRMNFIRHLPKTRDFLINDLKAVELQGYNKVADNTFVNLVPMFAGKFVEELPWDETMSSKPFDGFPFIWKNFSDKGYRSLYAEDAPHIAIFNYLKEGFHKPPADYYLRPWSLALEDHGSIWNKGRDCVGNHLETDLVLDYVKRFLNKFWSKPHFAFTFITRLTHDNINKASLADVPYLRFFQEVKSQGLIDDTFILFYSDHGMRFGDIRQTYIGKLEERLPFMCLVPPQWFIKKYPEHMRNLQENSNRLTTPFDVYETLTDILHFDGNIHSADLARKGLSLFSEIPAERSCAHAAILPHWCTCHQQDIVSPGDRIIKEMAHSLVDYINQLTELSKGLCAQLKIEKILDARSISVGDKILKFKYSLHDVIGRKVKYGKRTEAFVTYVITIRTQPGGGVFEATLGKPEKTGHIRLYGEISRINRYGDQGSCIKSHKLKKFCYC